MSHSVSVQVGETLAISSEETILQPPAIEIQSQKEDTKDERVPTRIPKDCYDYPVVEMEAMSANCPAPPCYYRSVGRLYVLYQTKKADGTPRLWCMVGPAWPMMFLTLGLIIGISSAVFAFVLPKLPWYIIPIAVLLTTATVSFYCITACSDPGIEPLVLEKPGDDWVYVARVQGYVDKSKRTIYDRETQVIARDVDHFCPWTGTLIAEGNIFCFGFFTTTLCVLCIFTIGIVIADIFFISGLS